jgi:hypothetical protein
MQDRPWREFVPARKVDQLHAGVPQLVSVKIREDVPDPLDRGGDHDRGAHDSAIFLHGRAV